MLEQLKLLDELDYPYFYDEGLTPGIEWPEELATALQNAARLLFFVTPESVASKQCRNEVAMALETNIPVLRVHLTETELTPGLILSLGSTQAIFRHDISADDYRRKLGEFLHGRTSQVPGPKQTTPPPSPSFSLCHHQKRHRQHH